MKRYREYTKADWTAFQQEITQFWEENKVFEQSLTADERPVKVFYEGPPSANGIPGIHHVMARTMKDYLCRFWTMQGYRVERKSGWDTHGLPVELQVEKSWVSAGTISDPPFQSKILIVIAGKMFCNTPENGKN